MLKGRQIPGCDDVCVVSDVMASVYGASRVSTSWVRKSKCKSVGENEVRWGGLDAGAWVDRDKGAEWQSCTGGSLL